MGGAQLPYLPPEALNGRHNLVDGPPADWWRFGCVVYEVLTGCPPFGGDSPAIALLKRIHDCDIHYSGDANDIQFLRMFFQVNPAARATWDELVTHPWFQSIDWTMV